MTNIVEYERLYEDDGSLLIAAESSWRGMAVELQELHYLRGAQFINQLKLIVYYGDFHPVEGENNIYKTSCRGLDIQREEKHIRVKMAG